MTTKHNIFIGENRIGLPMVNSREPEQEVLLWPSFGVDKDMIYSIYTPASCLSKPRSSLEAGKKLLRVWLQYVCGVNEMLLYLSFRDPLVFLWSPNGDSELARYRFEDGSKWCATGNVYSSVNEAGLDDSRIYVQGLMNLYSVFGNIKSTFKKFWHFHQ